MGIGLFLLKDVLGFMPGTITAQGTIIHCSYNKSSDSVASSCSPTIQFKTQSGQSITIGSSVSSSDFYEGKEVQVRYHAKTPQDGRIASFMDTWMFPLVFAGMGLLVVILGLISTLRGIIKVIFAFLLMRGVIGGNR